MKKYTGGPMSLVEKMIIAENGAKKIGTALTNYEEGWPIYDSGLDNGEDSFSESFRILFKEHNLRDFIYNSEKEQRDRVFAEFGGSASEAIEEMAAYYPNFFKRSVGVCLKDVRHRDRREQDAALHHEVLEGNVLTAEGLDSFKKWLGKDKLSVLLCRMSGGSRKYQYPTDPAYLFLILNNWYKLLQPRGLMLLESPVFPHSSTNDGSVLDFRLSDRKIKPPIKADSNPRDFATIISYIEKLRKLWGNENCDYSTMFLGESGRFCLKLIKPENAPRNLPSPEKL